MMWDKCTNAVIDSVDVAYEAKQVYYVVALSFNEETHEFSTFVASDFWKFFAASRLAEIQARLDEECECKFRYASPAKKSIELLLDGKTLTLQPHGDTSGAAVATS